MAHFYCEICHAAFMPCIMKSFDWTTAFAAAASTFTFTFTFALAFGYLVT